MMLTYCWH